MDWGDNIWGDITESVSNLTKGTAKVITGASSVMGAVVDVDNLIDTFSDEGGLGMTGMGLFVPGIPGGPPFENILEQFASYTPLWTLACLTPDQFNDPNLYRGMPGALDHVVFSSAGRYDDKRAPTVAGEPEYFVNNFNIEHSTAATKKTGQTNAIKMNFEVFEPLSMGYFIHSLQSAAINAGYPNYNGTPYLLKLEFVGHRDNGQMFASSEKLNKYFVIQITKCTFTQTEGGSTYKVEAVPANHSGFTNVVQQIKNNLRLRGETIKEMLVAGETSLCAMLNKAEYEQVQGYKQMLPDKYIVVFPENWSDKVGVTEDTLPAFEQFVESWYDVEEPYTSPIVGRSSEDTQDYGIGPIGASRLGFGATSGGNYNFGFESDVTDPDTGLIVRGALKIDPNQREFQFEAGATIQNIIQEIILSSEYAKDAIDPKNIDSEGMISWFRVDVQIKIGDFDLKRNCRQRTYIFRVLPFYVHSSVFRSPSANPPGYENLNKIIGKEYHYIYTGLNNDVLRFNIEINQLFHTGKQPTEPENSETVTNPAQGQVGEEPDQQYKVVDTGAADATTTVDAAPAYGDFQVTEITTKGGPGQQDVARRVAEQLKNAILNQGTGDMTKIELEILGDPYWISDSGMGNYIGDYYMGPGAEKAMITADGGLNYEGTDVYIRIIFRTPVEPNLGTSGVGGLYNFPPGERVNPYSGIYKVINCTSKFSDGKFTQVLKATRMPNQPWDYDPYKGPSKNPFAADITEQDFPSIGVGDDTNDFTDFEAWGIDLEGLPPGPTDEEIAQNNADLGDFPG